MIKAELHGKKAHVPERYRQDTITTDLIDPVSYTYPNTGIEKTLQERQHVLNKIKNNPDYRKLTRREKMAVKKYVCRKVVWWYDLSSYIRQAIAIGQARAG